MFSIENFSRKPYVILERKNHNVLVLCFCVQPFTKLTLKCFSATNSDSYLRLKSFRERDGLLDELAALRTEIAAVNSRLAQAEGDAERRRAEVPQTLRICGHLQGFMNYFKENEKRSLIEDLRVNFDRLSGEIKQKELLTDDLKGELLCIQFAVLLNG